MVEWFLAKGKTIEDPKYAENYRNTQISTAHKRYISYSERSRSNNIIKFIFAQCPNCGKWSLKPNCDLGRLVNPQQVYSMVEQYGRHCKICDYKNGPSELK